MSVHQLKAVLKWMVVLSYVLAIISGQSIRYDFGQCSGTVRQVLGASVTSQNGLFYTQSNLNCTATFLTVNPEMRFLVHFVMLDLPVAVDDTCVDSITLWQTASGELDSKATKLLGPLCGSLSSLPNSTIFSSPGHHISMVWRTGDVNNVTHQGFHVVLTATSSSPQDCVLDGYLLCSSGYYCVPTSLKCDGVDNCEDRSDEDNCTSIPDKSDQSYDLRDDVYTADNYSTTSKAATTTTTIKEGGSIEDGFEEVDMVSIVVVGVLFIVILMICVILACRSKSADLDALNEESNQLRLDLSTSAGQHVTDGLPSTPPPTYSMIERQTSYVSQISMSSSQVSVPPDYDEALELDSHGLPLTRRNSSLSPRRSSSMRTTSHQPVRSASGYMRSKPWMSRFTRAHSDNDSSRPRYLSQTSTISEVGPIDENDTGDTDDIFTHSDSTPENTQEVTPATSTPRALDAGYDIEMQREDSRAPLFFQNDGQDLSDTSGSDNAARMPRGSMDQQRSSDGSGQRDDNRRDPTC